MNQLMWEGINLMMLGMGAVFVFLTLLVFTTTLMSKLVNKYAPPVPAPAEQPAASVNQPNEPNQVSDGQLLAVISAAIHRHRSRHK
ncbi:hypothetical protein A9Q99_05145 [Gammaproteobacteria bacterium 45_16_T64]|nr:hypothetical protein A9Q99_05145 [Gammaproteobacteria bacterium 45_16_T64]